MCELVDHCYLDGAARARATDGVHVSIGKPRVTMDGVEFMMENPMMSKARQFLIDAKSTIPFI